VRKPSGCQYHSQSVVVEVAESGGDAAVEFDDAVDGFGSAVVGPAGGEVGQELVFPGAQGAAQSAGRFSAALPIASRTIRGGNSALSRPGSKTIHAHLG
jgi:hypothetical protein